MTTTDSIPMQAPARSPRSSVFIEDLASFEAATSGTHAVAGLYFFHQLDCLVQIAHKVAEDFFARPNVYVGVDDAVANAAGSPEAISLTLAKLQARFGYEESFPSDEHRAQIFLPIFGCGIDLSVPATGEFPALRDDVIMAATAFAQTGVDSGIDMLRAGFRTAAGDLARYLARVAGDSVRTSRELLGALTEPVSYAVLRSAGIAHAFGVTQPPISSWPYTPDANAENLVGLASTTLEATGAVSTKHLSVLSLAALRGAEALSMIIDSTALVDSADPNGNRALDQLIQKCYTWGVALSSPHASWSATVK